MSYCPNCGTKAGDKENICSKCGQILKNVRTKIFCPYSSRTPCDPKYYVDRKEVSQKFFRFRSFLMASNSAAIAITGSRGMGKTSVLRKLAYDLRKELIIPINISQQMNLNDFSALLIDSLEINHNKRVSLMEALIQKMKKMPRQLVRTLELSSVDLSGLRFEIIKKGRSPYATIDLVIDNIRDSGEKRCFVLIDDADLLTEPMLRLLRIISERKDFSVGTILAGDNNLIRTLSDKYPQFEHLVSGLVIKFLDLY